MKKKFVYLFPLGGKITWSGEDASNLWKRAGNDIDRAEIEQFIETSEPGDFVQLSTGEFIFRQR